MTTTDIAFVAPITIPGTTTKQTEFRSDQGWTVEIHDDYVELWHEQFGTVDVRGVGYAVRVRPAVRKVSQEECDAAKAVEPLEEGTVVVTQNGGQVMLPPEPPPETLRQWRKGKR